MSAKPSISPTQMQQKLNERSNNPVVSNKNSTSAPRVHPFSVRIVSDTTPIIFDEATLQQANKANNKRKLHATLTIPEKKPPTSLTYYLNRARYLLNHKYAQDSADYSIQSQVIHDIFTAELLQNPKSLQFSGEEAADPDIVIPLFEAASGESKQVSGAESMRVTLVDNLITAQRVIEELRNYEILSLDCEGVKLGRNGQMCLLQICPLHLKAPNNSANNSNNSNIRATQFQVYLFDIIELGSGVFDLGLRELLESPAILKLLYDCRRDSESLCYEFSVQLNNLLDIQLLQVAYLRQLGHECNILPSLVKTIDFHYSSIINAEINTIKLQMSGKYAEQPDCWRLRPLNREFQLYAGFDVALLCCLYARLTASSSSGANPSAPSANNSKFLNFATQNQVFLYSSTVWVNKFRSLSDVADHCPLHIARAAPNPIDFATVNREKWPGTKENRGLPHLKQFNEENKKIGVETPSDGNSTAKNQQKSAEKKEKSDSQSNMSGGGEAAASKPSLASQFAAQNATIGFGKFEGGSNSSASSQSQPQPTAHKKKKKKCVL
jgi:hypothetical protein